MVKIVLLLVYYTTLTSAYPGLSEENAFLEREYIKTPGEHQLLNWLTLQLRINNYPLQHQELPIMLHRLKKQEKRNSELTNSMLGIPRNMIDNGKK